MFNEERAGMNMELRFKEIENASLKLENENLKLELAYHIKKEFELGNKLQSLKVEMLDKVVQTHLTNNLNVNGAIDQACKELKINVEPFCELFK